MAFAPSAAIRNPVFKNIFSDYWIPDSRFAASGMTSSVF
jgi:hypothetical protein